MSYIVIFLFVFSLFLLCKNYVSKVTVFFVFMMASLELSVLMLIIYIAKFGQYPYPNNLMFVPDYYLYMSIHGIKIEYYTLIKIINTAVGIYILMMPIFAYSYTSTKFFRAKSKMIIKILLMSILPVFYITYYNPDMGIEFYEKFYQIKDIAKAQNYIKNLFYIDCFNNVWMIFYLFFPVLKIIKFGIQTKITIKQKQSLWIALCLFLLNFLYMLLFVTGVFRQYYVSDYSVELLDSQNFNAVNINNKLCTISMFGYTKELFMGVSLIKSISIPDYCYTVLPCIVIVMVMIMIIGMVKYKVLDTVDFFQQKVIKRNVQGLNKNLRGVFHSFKNMLFTIDVTLKNFKLESDEHKRQEIMTELENTISDSINNVSKMLNTLKNFDVELSKSNILEILEAAINTVRIDKNIDIIREYTDDDMDIYADEFCMTHALANIIQNASDAVAAAERENGKIIIEVFPEQEWIVIKITDNGIGISKKNINNIFKEFYTSKSRSHNNWGLGLYYTYKVVKKHMGYISVESKLGTKTMFQVILPRWDKNAKMRKGMSVYGKNKNYDC